MKIIIRNFLAVAAISFSSFAHRPLTWVAIGDSITYLNDHPNETGNRMTEGYLTQVTSRLPYIHYVNQGHNGWTATRIARAFDTLGVPAGADIYSVFLGTNDWWHSGHLGTMSDYTGNTGDTTVYGAFRIIVDKIRRLNKDASIILITPMQRGDFVSISNPKNNAYGSYREKDGQSLEQVANAVIAIAEYEKIRSVDLYHVHKLAVKHVVHFKRLKDPATGVYTDYAYPHYIDVPFHPGSDDYPYPVESIDMTYDGLHPSNKGCTVISKRLVKVMRKIP